MAEYDPKLVEMVARAIRVAKGVGHEYDRQAITALAAINASGIAWVAPYFMTEKMLAAQTEAQQAGPNQWAAMRDAYFAEMWEPSEEPEF